jgi:hypothetical protein
MKLFRFFLVVFILCFRLAAQAEEVTKTATEELVIPTVVSKPPYNVGDLVAEQGYYIDGAGDGLRINFRIVDNKLRVYWVDGNGLIAEPLYTSAVVRFSGSVRGRSYHRLNLLPSGAGLGAPGVILPPHLYNVFLIFPAVGSEEAISHSFRYTPALDAVVDPSAAVSE